MSIYVGDKQAVLYRGDYHPAQFYKGDVKIAGYNVAEKQGTEVEFEDTYNDNLDFKIHGKSEQNGIPSPDYPSPIRSSENFDVVSCGRNLIGIQNTTIILKNDYYKDSATGFTLYQNTRYTLSFDYVINSTSGKIFAGIGYGVNFYEKDIVGGVLYPNQIAGRTVAAFNSGDIGFDKKLFVRFVRASEPVTAKVDISNIQLEFGNAAVPYQPYHATTAHITDPLRSVGDVVDSIEVSDGKVEVVRRCELKAFDGTETWITGYPTQNNPRFHLAIKDVALQYPVVLFCNTNQAITSGISSDIQACQFSDGNFFYRINKKYLSTINVAGFAKYLQTHPTTILYPLATPTRTDITSTPLDQSLLSMRTIPHYTRIYTNADIKPHLLTNVKTIDRS